MDTNLPSLAPEADPAAHAFARLAEKVDLLEAAIAGLAAKREAAPDYSETLGEIAVLLQKVREAINTLARRPAMTLTPDAMAEQIAAAGKTARAEDSAAIGQARDRINKAAARLEYLAGTIATAREQRRHRLWAAGIGVLAGMLAWSILPGVTLRAMPQSWHMPESMAAHIIGEPTLWDAGTRLLRADSQQDWNTLTEAATILRDNREAIEKCQAPAGKAKKPVHCTVEIRPAS
ncbi:MULTISPECIES: DUF6118 family protein [unclassified Sphingobium]|jgi:hypothetical protein|uniref:DUF6118 family protein n=1 Tax=unclassified Sphingobium TaxID=2611147 RepID=UPI000C9F2CF5|nr:MULTISPECIES: DUF6118 family protein [unclassified Sphingobium]PNQ03435.1 hypothetical protein A8G00_11340 [Sphingobium sp. SA916]WDA35199.1 DUF6118 family protein [Sphingobium sp. YC-XJ3]WDA37265.1 DUF6118 family protein [Sphingobium sp. YC-XJ3]WDA38832.1 DUF6118 family protein [Sphingobium sp. YC-XJ3]